jgi:hypothetical protein
VFCDSGFLDIRTRPKVQPQPVQNDSNQTTSGSPWMIWIVGLIGCALLLPFLVRRDAAPPATPAPTPTEPTPLPADPPLVAVPQSPATPTNTHSYQADGIDRFRPLEEPANGYVSSTVCRECHESQHASWHESYHRTMTQVANSKTVLGDFENREFTFPGGEHYSLGRSGDEYWVEISNHPQLKAASGSDKVRLPVVLTTGSHHMQVYWFATGQGRNLGILPVVHLNGEEQWIPRDAAFIKPPNAPHSLEMARWNYTCNTCHTTDPRAEFDNESKSYDTRVSEFGISCESCHGPGDAHVNFQRGQAKLPPDDQTTVGDPIVNPATLDHRKSSQVCGACHVTHRRIDPKGKFTNYLPGQDYEKARRPLRMTEEFIAPLLKGATNEVELRKDLQKQFLAQFWPDGTIRIAGREYNGFIDSACHTRGEMSCISCHRLHQTGSDKRPVKEWANDLLQPSKQDDRGCLQCHDAGDYRSTAHTHHPLNSSGSSCYNCHMPHSVYGLLKAVRSHTIDSPVVKPATASDRPNACNLCHLDRTLEWTGKHLADWYGTPQPELSAEQREVAAGPLWTLKGDAGMRAMMAWHLGWEPAREAAITDWVAPYLSILMDDPYPAVRVIASRTMRKNPDYRQIAYDFLAPKQQRREPTLQVLAAWQKKQTGQTHQPTTLIGADGKPVMKKFLALLKARDQRPVVLAE